MKKLKLIGLVLVGTVTIGSVSTYAAGVWNVSVSTQKFIVNGQQTKADALNVNGSNYLKVADIAELLGASVTYDEKSDSVFINNSEPSTGVINHNNLNFQSQDNGSQKILTINNIDVKKLGNLEYISLGTYDLSKGDIIQYDVSATGKGNLSLGFVKYGDNPAGDDATHTQNRYFTTFDYGTNKTKTSTEPLSSEEAGKYTLYVCNVSDQPLSDIKGTVIIEKSK